MMQVTPTIHARLAAQFADLIANRAASQLVRHLESLPASCSSSAGKPTHSDESGVPKSWWSIHVVETRQRLRTLVNELPIFDRIALWLMTDGGRNFVDEQPYATIEDVRGGLWDDAIVDYVLLRYGRHGHESEKRALSDG